MHSILIIDDNESARNVMSELLKDEGYSTVTANDGAEGLVKLKQQAFDLILSDIKMPQMDGITFLLRLKEMQSDIPVIMVSGASDIPTAVEAVKQGAFDFIARPQELDRMLITIRNALNNGKLVKETKALRKKISGVDELVGQSAAITLIKEFIDKVAVFDSIVLITGPNGSGKELVAKWLHEKSNRNKHPLIEVNCAAIAQELIESELFGHERGSFTSAIKQHIGKFEQANKGTLFLDEIGDMSLSAQAKVLRALEEKKIHRVGGDRAIPVDVRFIAATNKDLQVEMKENRFRMDLFHRLSVINIEVPSLNDRREDIPLLIKHFMKKICTEHGVKEKEFSPEAQQLIQEYNWTGNIRELRNVVERLIILGGTTISEADVQTYVIPQR